MSERSRITFECSEELKARFDEAVLRGVRTQVLLHLIEMTVDFADREGEAAPYLLANGNCEINFKENSYERSV